MPDLDGIETCRRLKQTSATSEIPVIFVTANDETPSLVAGFAAGGVDYITKPLPALRDRLDDVPTLAAYFVQQFAGEMKRRPPTLLPDALQRLLDHSYPGNIRELKEHDRARNDSTRETVGFDPSTSFSLPLPDPCRAGRNRLPAKSILPRNSLSDWAKRRRS